MIYKLYLNKAVIAKNVCPKKSCSPIFSAYVHRTSFCKSK